MGNYTFIKSTIKDIDESFRDEGFSDVARLVTRTEPNGDGTFETYTAEFEKTTDGGNYDILLDRGSGRISRGFDSLLTMSHVNGGKNASSMGMLTSPIIFSNAKVIKTSTVLYARYIVLRNLGIENLIEPARAISPSSVDSILAKVDLIARDVQQGRLVINTYKSDMIIRCKSLVKLSNNATIKQGNLV